MPTLGSLEPQGISILYRSTIIGHVLLLLGGNVGAWLRKRLAIFRGLKRSYYCAGPIVRPTAHHHQYHMINSELFGETLSP